MALTSGRSARARTCNCVHNLAYGTAQAADSTRAVAGGEVNISADFQEERRRDADRRARLDPLYDGTERRRNGGRRAPEASPRTDNVLEPADLETFRPVPVILSRIRGEFDYVETDGAAGQRHVEAMIKALADRAVTSEIEDHGARARHLAEALNQAIHVRCGDNPTSEWEFLSATLVPGEPILFEYESLAHEIAARPLLQRLARALGYRIVQREAALRQVH